MGKQQPNLEELFPKKSSGATASASNNIDLEALFPKKKDDTVSSGKVSSTAGKSELPESSSAWYDWDNIKKAGSNLLGATAGLFQEIPSETTRMVGDTISALGLTLDLGGRYSSAGINYLMGNKKQAQKDIDSDPTFLGKYLIDAGQYLSSSADQTKDNTLEKWGVSEKNRAPQRSFYDAFSDGDLADGSAMLFRDVLATAPQMAAAILTGGGSLEAQALKQGTSGLLKQSALAEMGAIADTKLPSVLSTGLKSTAGGQFKFGLGLGTTSSLAEEYRKDNHLTATDFTESFARGVVEGISETMFDTDILAARKLASKFVDISNNPVTRGIMSSIVSEGEDEAKQKIVRTAGDILMKTFAGGKNEGLEEVASSFGNMLIDATKNGGFTLDSLEKFKKEAVESFIVGALSGGAISGAAAKLSRVKLTDVQQKTIDRYNEIAQDESLSDDARTIAKTRIKDILDYNADLSKENYRLVAALPTEKRAEALEYLYKADQLESDKRAAKDLTPDIDEAIKSYEDKVNTLIEEEYNKQQQERRKASMSQTDIDTQDIVDFFQKPGEDGFSVEDFDSGINNIRAKVNNNEEVPQDEINTAIDGIVAILDKIEKSELTPEQKKIASEPFYDQVTALESYDKTVKTSEVTTPINEVTRTTKEVGRVERPKTTVLTDRFNLEPVQVTDKEGKTSNFVARVNESGSITLVPKVKFSRNAEQQKRNPIELDSNLLQFQESIKDENDRVVGAKLLDRKTGNIIEISNPELAIDLATRAKQETLGNVSEGVMQQETTVKPIGQLTSVVKEFVNKKAAKVAPQVTTETTQEETPTLTTELPSSPVGLPSRRAYVVEPDVETKKGNRILNKIAPEIKKRIGNYVKALKATIPNTAVVLYDNKADMIEGLVNQGYSREDATSSVNESNGLYADRANTIHIDVMRMDKTTLPHEIFHPLVSKLAKENPEEFIALRNRISKVLSASQLKELDAFAKQYADEGKAVEAEEFLSQLGGLVTINRAEIDRGTLMKLALAVKEFLKKVAAKTNSKALADFADSIFTEQTKTDELIKFFEGFGRSLRQGEAINVEGLNSPVDLLGTESYEDGVSVEVNPDSVSDNPTIKASKIGKYSFPKGAVFETVDLPSKSLKDVVKEYDGRVIIITSDATGYGVDSLGEPILGGFGFSTIKKNVDDGIGFASVSEGAVKSTMSRAYNILGEGKAAVLVMIQPPFTTIGNSYGVKYFARGLRDIANKSPKQLKVIKQAMKDYVLSKKSIANELEKEDAKTGKRNTEKALFDLIDSINANTDINQFTKEFLKDTTFNSRTALLNGFITDSLSVRTNAKTDPVKLALREAGYSKVGFLNEYGDKSFLTEDMINNNIGNFVVGGFEVNIKSEEERNAEIASLQNKGIEHPLFNGKQGGTNHFVLDGLYDVNENFSEYAVPESAIDMPDTERDSMVRELYTKDSDYKPESRTTPIDERKYTDLLAENKISFKKDVLMPKGLIKFNKANVASSVARSMGYNLEAGKREDLKAAEFKQSQRDTLRQQKSKLSLADSIRGLEDNNYDNPQNVYSLDDSGEFALLKSWVNNMLDQVANKLGNRKLAGLIRKHINPDFNASNYARKGMSFDEAMSYINMYAELSDGKNDLKFVTLLKDVGINVPAPNNTNTKISSNPNLLAEEYLKGDNINLNNAIDLLLRDSKTLRQQKSYPDALEDSRKAYLAKFKNTPQEVSRYVRKLLFERNINIKKAMQDAELEFSLYTMYNKAGASMFGNLKFTEKFNEIYGNLTPEEVKLVDNIVFLRRVVAIDTNFDNRNLARPKHTSHKNIDGVKTTTNKESALSSLEDYKDLLGSELYDKVYSASDKYFKAFSDILKYKYENGLIDKATYELYKDYNYSPRKFLQFMFGTSISQEAELSSNNFFQRGLALSKEELSRIKDGSDEEIFADSAKLLHAAMIATEVRVASNLALKTLYNEAIPLNLDFVKEVEYEKYQDGTIKVNPDGSLKYDKTPDKGFRIVTFKENGAVKAFQLREDLAKEYFDEELFDKNSKAYKFAQLASGANILRNMATGMNLAFPITNIPVDVISQVQLNNIYDGAGVGVAGQYAKAFSGAIANSVKLIPMEWGKSNKALEDLIYEYGKAGGLMMSMSQEYAAKDKFFGEIAKYLGSFGNASEMASKLTAYKAAKEREIKLFTEKNGVAPTGEDLSKIQTKAAFIARSAMDYHRGGLLTKWLDGFIPYLNVFTQASKITVDYIRKNPAEFTKKITQAGIFVMGLTIYNMMVAGSDYDNDDNEQDLNTKLLFFFPFKNADGTRGKLEFATPSPVKFFLNIFQNIGEGIYYQAILNEPQKTDEWKIKVKSRLLSTVSPNLSTNIPPALKAMIEYSYNLDLWRNKDITTQLGKVLPQDEGRFDKNVAEFYKIIGSATGKSPIRLQKASENFITQSNPLVGLGYALMDKSINSYTNMPESQRSKFDKGQISDIPVSFLDKVAGRVYSVTDPKVTFSKANEIIDRINQTAGSKKQEVKAEMKMLVEKNASVAELNKFLITQDPIYRKVALDYRNMLENQKQLNFPDNKGEYFDIMTGENAEAKAQILYAYFPYLLEPGNEKLQSDLLRLKLYGNDTKIYFNKYVKNKGVPK